MAPMTDGDTICNGDTAMIYSDADYTIGMMLQQVVTW